MTAANLELVGAPPWPAGFDRLIARLEKDFEPLCAIVLESYFERLDPSSAEPELPARLLDDFTRQALRAQLLSLRAATQPDRCPEYALGAAAAIADRAGVETLINVQRIVHMVLWEAWFALVEDSSDFAPSQRRQLLSRGSEFFFQYTDLLCAFLAEAHRAEAGRLPGTREQRRLRAVTEFLGGDPLIASWLDLDLDRHHLGLLAWGEQAADAARQLAEALGRPLFIVNPLDSDRCCWAWISAVHPLGPAEHRYLKSHSPTDARVALGLEAFGEAGFRATHRQAQRARGFARPEGPAVLRYEDYIVEALATENEEDARAFLAHELRGIEDDSPRSRRIRETLQAYFAAESNAACAAAALGVHQQTVANRLRAAEERLGLDSIGARRLELELALRLR